MLSQMLISVSNDKDRQESSRSRHGCKSNLRAVRPIAAQASNRKCQPHSLWWLVQSGIAKQLLFSTLETVNLRTFLPPVICCVGPIEKQKRAQPTGTECFMKSCFVHLGRSSINSCPLLLLVFLQSGTHQFHQSSFFFCLAGKAIRPSRDEQSGKWW